MTFLKLKIPPVVLVLIFMCLMWLLKGSFEGLSFNFSLANVFAIAFVLLGIIIALSGVYAFKQAQTTVDPRTPEKASSLVNSGTYKVTRNPMYLGFLCLLIAFAFYLQHLLAFALLPAFIMYMNAFQIIPEEQMLGKLFGKEFDDYCNSVRRWL